MGADCSVLASLKKRGFITQLSDPEVESLVRQGRVTIYGGFDPTAPSLHVGHLLPIMALSQFQRAGHQVIALFGGATGMIGDPSGRSDERNLLTPEAVTENLTSIKQQMARFMTFEGDNAAVMVDNNEWIGKMSFVEWLRDVGKYFTVNYMLAKDSVRTRMGGESGISYTEFSYMTMQAYDFLFLYDHHQCTVQCGGNDQWGNITAGIELVRRTRAVPVYGITFPLITTSSGEKFGKSAGNAVWLDSERTSVYQFYQYWIRTEDSDVERFLKFFTFLPLERINEICDEHRNAPERRNGQKILAAEVTRLVHGDDGLERAMTASSALFGGDIRDLNAVELQEVFHDVPNSEVTRQKLCDGVPLTHLLCENGICVSKSEARRMTDQGAIYVNNVRANESDRVVNSDDILAGSNVVIRKGKKDFHLIRITD